MEKIHQLDWFPLLNEQIISKVTANKFSGDHFQMQVNGWIKLFFQLQYDLYVSIGIAYGKIIK